MIYYFIMLFITTKTPLPIFDCHGARKTNFLTQRTRKIALLQWKIQKRLFRGFVLSWLNGENETDINIQKPKIIKSL